MSNDNEAQRREFAGTARFEIVRRLGAGGMGVVYEAIDKETNATVALKTLRSLSADGLFRFKNEFRQLQGIHHPNLVTLGELFEDQGQWFFTMELVAGAHFLAWVREDGGKPKRDAVGIVNAKPLLPSTRDDGPPTDEEGEGSTIDLTVDLPETSNELQGVDVGRLRSSLAQLARGLHALHAAGKVHRDIKPSNILVTPEGRVVILDFGLITDVREGELEKRFVGTVGYMAPEQTEMKLIGPAADWYAVGVMLYQALAGRLPLTGSLNEVVAMKRSLAPAPPSQAVSGVPEDLDALAMELMAIDPGARPSGEAILKKLHVEAGAAKLPAAARFVGRERELATLKSAFVESRAGATVTVIVHGESGVGKSALTKRFLGRVVEENPGAVVLAGRCYERESVPYKAIDGVIDALSKWLATIDATALLPRQRALLGQVFPVMRRVRAIAEAPSHGLEALDPQIVRARLFAALRDLLSRAAAHVPLVLNIDDLQWSDADSLALLAAVLRPPDAPRLLLVATMRSNASGEGGARSVSQMTPLLTGDVRSLAVEALPARDAQTLAAVLLRDAGANVPTSADAIAAEAGGHPMFIDELVRRRLASGAGAAPLRLDEALWLRIEELDEVARMVLETISVAGTPIAQESAAHATGIAFSAFAEQVAMLRAYNLVRTRGARRVDAVEAYHDRVREAVLTHLDETSRRDTHERLALALEAAGNADPESLSIHWRGAGNDRRAFEHTVHAAERAMAAFAFDRAARLYRIALDLRDADSLIDEKRLALLTGLGDALVNAGRGRDAATAYLEAAAMVSGADALDLRRRAAEQLLHSGHVDEALATMKLVLAAVGMELPSSQKAALASLVFRRAQVRVRGLSFKRRDASAIPPEDLTRIDTCWAVGSGLGLVDTIVGSYFQTRGLLLALEAGEPNRVVRAIAAEACYTSASGGGSASRTAMLVASATSLANELAAPYGVAWAEGANGMSAALEGRFGVALGACDRAEQIFRDKCTGVAWEIHTVRWFGAWSLAYLGQLKELARRIPARFLEAHQRGDLYAEIAHATGLPNLVYLMDDDPVLARSRCRAVMNKWSQKKFHVEHWWAMLAERQVDLYEGLGRDAMLSVTEDWPALDGSLLLLCQLTLLEALHLRARVALAAALEQGSDRGALLASAEKDAKKMLGEKMAWSTPLAELLLAGVASSRGDRQGAIERLERAAAGLDAADLALYAIAARYRLGALRGGSKGALLTATARDWLLDQGVKNPAKMVAMLAPGFEAR